MKIYLEKALNEKQKKWLQKFTCSSKTLTYFYSDEGIFIKVGDNKLEKINIKEDRTDYANINGKNLTIDKSITIQTPCNKIPFNYSCQELIFLQYYINDKLKINLYDNNLTVIDNEFEQHDACEIQTFLSLE